MNRRVPHNVSRQGETITNLLSGQALWFISTPYQRTTAARSGLVVHNRNASRSQLFMLLYSMPTVFASVHRPVMRCVT